MVALALRERTAAAGVECIESGSRRTTNSKTSTSLFSHHHHHQQQLSLFLPGRRLGAQDPQDRLVVRPAPGRGPRGRGREGAPGSGEERRSRENASDGGGVLLSPRRRGLSVRRGPYRRPAGSARKGGGFLESAQDHVNWCERERERDVCKHRKAKEEEFYFSHVFFLSFFSSLSFRQNKNDLRNRRGRPLHRTGCLAR